MLQEQEVHNQILLTTILTPTARMYQALEVLQEVHQVLPQVPSFSFEEIKLRQGLRVFVLIYEIVLT